MPRVASAGPSRGWSELPRGSAIEVVKLRPDGSEATRYPGSVIEALSAGLWLAVEARWTMGEIALDGLRFVPGDRLHEYFSSEHPFNVFAIFSPEGALRGWYANVTYPSWIEWGRSLPVLFWHDLYVDVIALPSGITSVRDEDELAEAAPSFTDPDLEGMILEARDELLRRVARREFPFHDR
jgi:hypothetical protein